MNLKKTVVSPQRRKERKGSQRKSITSGYSRLSLMLTKMVGLYNKATYCILCDLRAFAPLR
jgi:hypothetical protein